MLVQVSLAHSVSLHLGNKLIFFILLRHMKLVSSMVHFCVDSTKSKSHLLDVMMPRPGLRLERNGEWELIPRAAPICQSHCLLASISKVLFLVLWYTCNPQHPVNTIFC